MQESITGGSVAARHWSTPPTSTLVTVAVIVVACIAPIAAQRFLSVSPALIGSVGVPVIVLLGFLGSATVFVPVPVLPLVFTGAAILNPVVLVVAAAASITAGMAVCYILGRRGHSRAVRVAASSRKTCPDQSPTSTPGLPRTSGPPRSW
ncbi:MAG: hypothetical protein QF357_07080 [Dehalococcoidia bacterium]|nr:hypothetical protein [Dehalococcoidia bacterium]